MFFWDGFLHRVAASRDTPIPETCCPKLCCPCKGRPQLAGSSAGRANQVRDVRALGRSGSVIAESAAARRRSAVGRILGQRPVLGRSLLGRRPDPGNTRARSAQGKDTSILRQSELDRLLWHC